MVFLLLFGGGGTTRLEFTEWREDDGPMVMQPMVVQGGDSSNGGGDAMPEGSFVQLCTFEGGGAGGNGAIVGYLTTENKAGLLFVQWNNNNNSGSSGGCARNLSFHPWNNVTAIAMDRHHFRMVLGDAEGEEVALRGGYCAPPLFPRCF